METVVVGAAAVVSGVAIATTASGLVGWAISFFCFAIDGGGLDGGEGSRGGGEGSNGVDFCMGSGVDCCNVILIVVGRGGGGGGGVR